MLSQSRTASYRPSLLLFILLTPLVVALLGCGGATSPVTGVVTLDDTPLQKASVIFYPVEGGRGNSVAPTDENGKFELYYTNTDVGAIPGKYKVLITKVKVVNNAEVETVPVCYNQESTKIVEVTKSGDNFFEFKLNSKGE